MMPAHWDACFGRCLLNGDLCYLHCAVTSWSECFHTQFKSIWRRRSVKPRIPLYPTPVSWYQDDKHGSVTIVLRSRVRHSGRWSAFFLIVEFRVYNRLKRSWLLGRHEMNAIRRKQQAFLTNTVFLIFANFALSVLCCCSGLSLWSFGLQSVRVYQ